MSGAGADDSQGRPPAAEAETELGSFESAAARPVALPSAVTQLSNAASIPDQTPAAGFVLAGKYRLTEMLGQGGMGTVYAAEQIELAVPVAIKLMHPHVAAHAEYVERFRREARAAMLLNHPKVVRVIDFGQHDKTFFIVMELIEGEPLDNWIFAHPRPPPFAEVVPIMCDVLEALEAAHALGIVHRDLKPENILLTHDSQGHRYAKVVDFGLAHVDAPDDGRPTLTRADAVAGTPAYMSPEQSRSLRVSPAADLYSMGCILTELLQMSPPFDGAPMEIVSQHLFMAPPALKRPDGAEPVPALLEKLRLELLAKHPHQRPADAASVRERLLEAMDPAAHAKRLPSRKGELSGGGRQDRIPDWNEAEAASPSTPEPRESTALLVAASSSSLHDVAVATGLAAHGIRPARAESMADALAASPDVIVLDAAGDIDAAVAALAAGSAGVPVVILVRQLDPGSMRRLIEAGAADVIAQPVTPDVLSKKLARLLRRRAHKS